MHPSIHPSIHLSIYPVFAMTSQQYKDYKFLFAARDGNIAAIKSALKKGANINAKTDTAGPALFYAAINGNKAGLQFLLNVPGVEVDMKEPSMGFTAVHSAATRGHVDCLRLLIDAGADVNSESQLHNGTPLRAMWNNGMHEAVAGCWGGGEPTQ